MNKIPLLFLLLCQLPALAQDNLKFNQAIRVKFTPTLTVLRSDLDTAGTITVPKDKVWKIESGSIAPEDRAEGQSNELYIDGQLLFYKIGIAHYIVETTNGPFVFNSPPIWLPSGVYTVTYRRNAKYRGLMTIAISGVEYGIAP